MLPPGLKSPREVILYYDEIYNDLIATGKAHPFMYPWGAIGAYVVMIYLLIDHRHSRWLERSRYLVYAFLCVFSGWCIATNRAKNPASAFGVGLISSWATLWTGSIMIANDCQTDFWRIERTDGEGGVSAKTENSDQIDGNTAVGNGSAKDSSLNGELRKRTQGMSTLNPSPEISSRGPTERHGPVRWQAYPEKSFIERLDWVADVFCSFRLVGWNKQTNGVPPPPTWVQAQLDGNPGVVERIEPEQVSKTGIRRSSDRRALVRECTFHVVVGYFALDAIKTFIMNDPYFWGYTNAPAPDFMPAVIRSSYFLTSGYRLVASLTAIITALWTIFKLGPFFFCGILGPKWVGARGEPWMNPPNVFGSFNNVLDKGLAGWWGGWWHQTFRFAFEAPSVRILEAMNIEARSLPGKMVSLFIAFSMSGCLHACGSYTQLGDTRPLKGPFSFFMLQACGILVQTIASGLLAKAGVTKRSPKIVKRLTNFVFVHFWLYNTAHLLVDDFAQGGVWLFEPVPISLFRGLGLGPKDEGWFCWTGGIFWWRTGNHFWDTGIAL